MNWSTFSPTELVFTHDLCMANTETVCIFKSQTISLTSIKHRSSLSVIRSVTDCDLYGLRSTLLILGWWDWSPTKFQIFFVLIVCGCNHRHFSRSSKIDQSEQLRKSFGFREIQPPENNHVISKFSTRTILNSDQD